jgi:hypothetical protein
MTAISIDKNLANSDWIRSLSWSLPTNADSFLSAIGGESSLASFMELPAAKPMPDSLKDQLVDRDLLPAKSELKEH